MKAKLFDHFYSEEPNGFFNNCDVTLIDKTDDSDQINLTNVLLSVIK